MKRIIIITIAISEFLVIGCGHSSKTVSSALIVNQVNTNLSDLATNQAFVEIRTGTYECNDAEARKCLRSMSAAGLIDYSVDRYAWWEKTSRNVKKSYTVRKSGWLGYYNDTEYKWVKEDDYQFCEHYVVSVFLTSRGKKLEVDELPTPVKREDKDMVQPVIKESKYEWNKQRIDETWPEIENPFISPSRRRQEQMTDNAQKNSESQKKETSKEKTVYSDSLRVADYSELVFTSEPHYLKAYSVKAVKARNIVVIDGLTGPVATAEVILQKEKVTDPGRIYHGIDNGSRSLMEVALKYYCDKGWILLLENEKK